MVYAWLPYDPENTQAFEFLGTAAHALGDIQQGLGALPPSSLQQSIFFNNE